MDLATKTVSLKNEAAKRSKSFGMDSFLKTLLLLLGIVLNFSSVFAQKTLNAAELQQDLTEVNAKLQEVEEKIEIINSRLESAGASSISPELQQKLSDLEAKKNQYQREKTSIEAALNSIQGGNGPNDSSESNTILYNNDYQVTDQIESTKNQ